MAKSFCHFCHLRHSSHAECDEKLLPFSPLVMLILRRNTQVLGGIQEISKFDVMSPYIYLTKMLHSFISTK
jgi:hypothetical protein